MHNQQKHYKKTIITNKKDDLLLSIPQAALEIYPKEIVVYKQQKLSQPQTFTKTVCLKDQNIIFSHITINSIHKLNDDNVSHIIPLDNYLAFEVLHEQNCVRIQSIVDKEEILKFHVNRKVQLHAVNAIFKGKLPEIGFNNKYKIIEKIGTGRTAEVYLAQRIADKRKFAIKMICFQDVNNAQYKLFSNQVTILRKLNHPNIIKLQNFCYEEGKFYLVLEYLNGNTLRNQFIYNFPRSKVHAQSIIYDIIKGLQYLRQKTIVHRDIKLDNIMIRKLDNGIKEYVICDFGLSGYSNQQDSIFLNCGTPGYLAPQTFNCQNVQLSHKLDIFAYGIIAHMTILKSRPFDGNSIEQIMKANQKGQIDFTKQQYKKLSSVYLKLLKGSLCPDPDKRYAAFQILQIFQQTFKQSQREYRLNCQKQFLKSKNKQQLLQQMMLERQNKTIWNKITVNKISQKQSVLTALSKKEFSGLNKQMFTKKKIQTDSVSWKFSSNSFKNSLEKIEKSNDSCFNNQNKSKKKQKKVQSSYKKPKRSKTFLGNIWEKIVGKSLQIPRQNSTSKTSKICLTSKNQDKSQKN